MAKSANRVEQRMESLERAVVFRTARGSFFLMAVVATLTFASGVVLGTFGYIKAPIARPAPPPPLPPVAPPPPLTYQQVEAWLAARDARARDASATMPTPVYGDDPDEVSASDEPPTDMDPERERLATLDSQLRALFPTPPYQWDDRFERACVTPTDYGCLRYEKRLLSAGLSRAVRTVLEGRPRPETIATLELLVSILGQAPVERRGALLAPTIAAQEELLADYRQQVAARAREVARQQSTYEEELGRHARKVARQAQAKADQRRWGLYGVVAGLGFLILVSVFLVHFAIERHLRLLRDLVRDPRGDAPAPSPATGRTDAVVASIPGATAVAGPFAPHTSPTE